MMNNETNPFICESASSFDPKLIKEIFIKNHNYSRLLLSRRNFFILGERGSGKSMILRFHSLPVQILFRPDLNSIEYIGIYVPCNTPLSHKKEHEFFEPHLAMTIAEHYLVLSLAQALIDTLQIYVSVQPSRETSEALEYFKYVIAENNLPDDGDILASLAMYIERLSATSQLFITKNSDSEFYSNALTFNSFIVPLLRALRKIPAFKDKHFMFLVDDAHDLNDMQKQILNSYIAYRDHSVFSFKVAIADIARHTKITAQGSTVLESHDYTLINLEKDFQSKDSSFGLLAKDIVERRLFLAFNKKVAAEDFFPLHPSFDAELKSCNEEAKKIAIAKYGQYDQKKIRDYIYKYGRVIYFRNRKPKAPMPIYSGFNTIAHASTGVIRKLLEPCFKMYDESISKNSGEISCIDPKVQQQVLISMSDTLWKEVKCGYCDVIKGCSAKDSEMLYNFLDKLGILFRERLHKDISQPRVLTFTISSLVPEYRSIIEPVFAIARKAQLLYNRIGPSKDDGVRETYYVPNRLLWISRGLDPEGQHGRIPLKAQDIVNAMNGINFPYSPSSDSGASRGSLLNV